MSELNLTRFGGGGGVARAMATGMQRQNTHRPAPAYQSRCGVALCSILFETILRSSLKGIG